MEDIKDVKKEEEKLQEEIKTSVEDAVKTIEEGQEEQEEIVKQMDDVIESIEDGKEELSEENRKFVEELSEDLKDVKEIDERMAKQFEKFKDVISIDEKGFHLNMVGATVSMLSNVHSDLLKMKDENDTISEFFSRYYQETEDKNNPYSITFNKDEDDNKIYYVLRKEWFKIIPDTSYKDIDGNEHNMMIPDMDKLEVDVFKILGNNDNTKDLLAALAHIYGEIHKINVSLYFRDKSLLDYDSAYKKFFDNLGGLVNDFVKELNYQIVNEKIARKEFKTQISFIYNSINNKLKKEAKISVNIGPTMKSAIDLLGMIVINRITTSSTIDEVNSIFDSEKKMNQNQSRALELTIARRIRKNTLDKADLLLIPAFIKSLSSDYEKNPFVYTCKRISEEIHSWNGVGVLSI